MFSKILFCTDLSEKSEEAFRTALKMTQACANAQLVLFHVVPEPDAQFWKTYIYEVDQIDQKAKRDIDARLQDLYLSRLPEGLSCKVRIAVGSVRQKMLEAIQEETADLLIMGRQGSSTISSFFFGDTSRFAMLKAPCPVLIVPSASAVD